MKHKIQHTCIFTSPLHHNQELNCSIYTFPELRDISFSFDFVSSHLSFCLNSRAITMSQFSVILLLLFISINTMVSNYGNSRTFALLSVQSSSQVARLNITDLDNDEFDFVGSNNILQASGPTTMPTSQAPSKYMIHVLLSTLHI